MVPRNRNPELSQWLESIGLTKHKRKEKEKKDVKIRQNEMEKEKVLRGLHRTAILTANNYNNHGEMERLSG